MEFVKMESKQVTQMEQISPDLTLSAFTVSLFP